MAEITILIPCKNEAPRLPDLLERLDRVVIDADLDCETIVLDDASDDDTVGVAMDLQRKCKALNIRIIRRFETRRGYGALIRYGLAYARGRYCLLMAADGAHPIESLPAYVAAARKGAHLVQCSRYETEEDSTDIPQRFRLYQAVYRLLVRLLLGWDIRDPTCSFKLVDRIFLLAIGIGQNSTAVVPEITLKVWMAGGEVVFIPGRQSFRERGISQFRFLREAMGYTYVLLRGCLHRRKVWPWF